MRIGITGGGGFIGRALAKRAISKGHEVVCFDLDERARGAVEALGATFMPGDITRSEDIDDFVRGLDRIHHTAAIVREIGEWDAFWRVNVEAPRDIAKAARRAGVKELVHFSSVMVYGFDFPDMIAEDGPLDPAGNVYCTTKIASERFVLDLHEPGKLDVYVIRPGDVYGPGSIPWTIRPVQMMKAGDWIWVEPERAIFNHVWVENLVDGVELILDEKASGRPFNITDDRRTTVREFFSYYQRFLGKRSLPTVPAWLAYSFVDLASAAAKLQGKSPDSNRQSLRYMTRKGQYSADAIISWVGCIEFS